MTSQLSTPALTKDVHKFLQTTTQRRTTSLRWMSMTSCPRRWRHWCCLLKYLSKYAKCKQRSSERWPRPLHSHSFWTQPSMLRWILCHQSPFPPHYRESYPYALRAKQAYWRLQQDPVVHHTSCYYRDSSRCHSHHTQFNRGHNQHKRCHSHHNNLHIDFPGPMKLQRNNRVAQHRKRWSQIRLAPEGFTALAFAEDLSLTLQLWFPLLVHSPRKSTNRDMEYPQFIHLNPIRPSLSLHYAADQPRPTNILVQTLHHWDVPSNHAPDLSRARITDSGLRVAC